ncbi:MAG: hypothetical protein ACK40L_02165 [Hydrogenophaga sp.]
MNKVTVVRGITATNATSTTEPQTPPAPAAGQVQDARARLLAEMIQKYDLNQDGTLNAQEQARAEAETGLDLSSIHVDVAPPAAPLGKRVHVYEVSEVEFTSIGGNFPYNSAESVTRPQSLRPPTDKPFEEGNGSQWRAQEENPNNKK